MNLLSVLVAILFSCIIPLHCFTGCDANSARVVYDKVAKSSETRQQLSKRGNSPDIEEEAIEELFEFTRLVICGDKVSRTMGTAQAVNGRQ